MAAVSDLRRDAGAGGVLGVFGDGGSGGGSERKSIRGADGEVEKENRCVEGGVEGGIVVRSGGGGAGFAVGRIRLSFFLVAALMIYRSG